MNKEEICIICNKKNIKNGICTNCLKESILFYYDYKHNFNSFIKKIIELDFGSVRHVLRIVGRKRANKKHDT